MAGFNTGSASHSSTILSGIGEIDMDISEYLQAVSAHDRLSGMGFNVGVDVNGYTELTVRKGMWRGFSDKASWKFRTVEEAVAFASGICFGLVAANNGVSSKARKAKK
jgi:hypothetical protein